MVNKISADVKESILKKAFNRGNKSLSQIADENGIGHSTIAKWVKKSNQENNGKMLSPAEKFQHLQAIAKLNDEEIGAYCRQHGLYSIQLKDWEKDFMQKDSSEKKYKAEVVALRKRNAELERELRRKEKALAEAAALLILKKKAEEIWGDDKED